MKKILLLLFCIVTCTAFAQSLVSPNLVNPTTGNPQLTLGGTTNYTGTGGGFSGGSIPGYNSTNNTIYFGYSQKTVALTYAFSQALQNSGMTIQGYNYSWDYINQGTSAGTLSASVNFAATNGTSLHSKNWSLGTTTDWTTISGTETFANSGLLASSISNFSLNFTGKDNRFWAGYYGPQVRNPSLSLNYTFDACSSNPLSSPSCPGYAQAYLNQQCNANPLYNQSCPGYLQAYHDQQCSINPLFATDCPGYAQAYFNQQCSINPLYNSNCPGYAEAYKTQQCNLNGLYDRSCPNYSTAYATKQLTTTNTTQSTTTVTTSAVTDPVTTITNPVSVATTTSSTTSSTSPTSVTSVTSVIAPAPAPAAQNNTTTSAPVSQSTEQKQETKKTENTVASIEKKAESKSDAKAAATEKAKQIAKQAGGATSMEAQMETQTALLGLMGYVPGFSAYNNSMIRDINEREMMKKYTKDNVDNRSILRRLGGASESRWSEMVDSQYKIAE
jgi:hypothetical protein